MGLSTRDKLIQRYETRDLEERNTVYIMYKPRASQQGLYVLSRGVVSVQLTNA